LIADGTIGQDDPNAADFQIGTTVRVFLAFEDLAPLVEGRPAAALAKRILPEYPGPVRRSCLRRGLRLQTVVRPLGRPPFLERRRSDRVRITA